MDRLLFGTGGIPHSAGSASTVSGIERIAELGLGCMELEFVRRVSMGEIAAKAVREAASRLDVKLTAHAPYYINLNSREPDKIEAGKTRLLQAAYIGSLCGAESVIFHAGFYMGDEPAQAYKAVKQHLAELLEELKTKKVNVTVRPELMGGVKDFGTIDDLLNLSAEFDGVAPGIDFAHWHARTGKFNSYAEFVSLLQQIEKRLGKIALENMHMHVSGIKYSEKGEIAHLDLEDSDFQYTELVKALKDCEVKGTLICESPNLEEDALLLQKTYSNLSGGQVSLRLEC